MKDTVDVLIVGAGLAGIQAARTLTASGKRVRLFDKGRRPGGRMATRECAGASFDYGAQFFTARDPAFVAIVEDWEENHDADIWCHGFPTPDEPLAVDDGHPRFRIFDGMFRLISELTDGLDIRSNAKVSRVERKGDCWVVALEDGSTHTSRALMLTPPVPQSLALIRASGCALPGDVLAVLSAIEYDPCLALRIQLSGPSAVPQPGAIRPAGEPVHILVDNYLKGVSRRPGALTLHAGPVFSRRMYDAPEAEILAALLEVAEPWLGSTRERVELHRWRYSHPVRTHAERLLVVPDFDLCFAGDAFGGPRVEGAVLSGLAAGTWLSARLA